MSAQHHAEVDLSQLAHPGPSCYRDAQGRFEIIAAAEKDVGDLIRMDPYSAATAFVTGEFLIQGDLIEAIRFFTSEQHSTIKTLWYSIAARLGHGVSLHLQDRSHQTQNIQFHYDRSNEFCAQFLDTGCNIRRRTSAIGAVL